MTDTPPPKPERHLASHIFNVIVLVGGTVGLVVLLRQLGWDKMRAVFAGVGWWFFAVVGIDVVGMSLDAAAIHAFMRPESRMVSYWRVFAAQASGRAISILTPGGVVGEATKISMLVSHAPRDRVVSSIVLFNLAAFYISVGIVMIGVPITALSVDLPHQLAVVVWIALAILTVIVVGLGLMIHRGAVDTVMAAARGLHIVSAARLDKWRTQIKSLDSHLKELHSDQSPGTRTGLVLLCISRVVAWSATTTVLHLVGVHVHPTLLIGVLSVGVLISWISAIVPLGLGVADGGNLALFKVLGAEGATGAFVTMLGRARSLAIALIGLTVMAVAHTVNRVSVARRVKRMRAARAHAHA